MPRDMQQEWGQRIRAARKARGLSVVELAALVGRSRASIYRLEDGNVAPSDEQRIRIAAALDVTPGELFAYPEEVAS